MSNYVIYKKYTFIPENEVYFFDDVDDALEAIERKERADPTTYWEMAIICPRDHWYVKLVNRVRKWRRNAS